jgi:ferredoxin
MFKIEVELKEQKKQTIFVYGDLSILNELENYQIFLDHNCRQGHCGTCVMELISGEVHQKNNLIHLSADEILTCCAFPKSDIYIKEKQ